jgi:hypothetical protein
MPLKGGTDHGRRSVLVDFIGLVQHLGRDLTGFGGPLSQWNAFGFQNGFLLCSCGRRQVICDSLSDLKHSHNYPPLNSSYLPLIRGYWIFGP